MMFAPWFARSFTAAAVILAVLVPVRAYAAEPVISEQTVLQSDFWTEMPPLPEGISGHRAVLAGRAIIVLGGRNRAGASQKSVFAAPVRGNGTLGDWKKSPDLPFALSGHAAVECGGVVYVCGGYRLGDKADIMSNQVIYGEPGKDGIIRQWKEAASLPMRVHSHGIAAYDGRVYIAGGYTPAGCVSSVLVGETGKGGGIASWGQTLSLPTPLYNIAVTTIGRYLVVIGGQSPAEGKTLTVPTAYVGPIWKDGSITTWYLASSKLPANWLSFGRSKSSAVAYGNAIFCFGGQDAMWFPVNSVAYVSFDSEKGEMGEWAVMPRNDNMQELTEAISWKDNVYLVGGVKRGLATAQVLRGKFAVIKREEPQ